MVCVYCGARTNVVNSRLRHKTNEVWRRRRCLQCQAIISTTESVEYHSAWQVKSDSTGLEPFSRDKLFLSLYSSMRHRISAIDDANSLATTIIGRLRPTVTRGIVRPGDIYAVASIVLSRFDSTSFNTYRAFYG